MRYLIILRDPETGRQSAAYTEWRMDIAPEYGAVVGDMARGLISFDNGKSWKEIEDDHL